jgi:site-specific recombinase XerD
MSDNFDPTLWHPETLQLTPEQESSLHLLQEVITKSTSEVAKALRLCEPLDWTHKDIRKLETDLLKHVAGHRHLRQVYDILPKVIARYHERTNSNCCFPQSISRVRLENNPFHADIAASQRLINQLSDFVVKTANDLPTAQHAHEADPACFEKAITLGVLSSIVQLHLLHKSMLIALIESLADREKSLLSANRHCYCWSLSLAWQGEPDAEHRIFVPDQLTGVLFASVPEVEIRRTFANGLDQSQPLKKRHKAIYAALEQACHKLLESSKFHQQVDLKILLQAAGTVAYLRMPAAIAAARCRKTVHHSPRNQVMLRIFRGLPVRKDSSISVETRLSASEFRDAEMEVADTTQVVPAWLEAMRTAFKLESPSKVRDALLKIEAKEAQPGPILAHFASSLMTESHLSITSAKAYGMLIARRFGCRIGNSDPSTLPIAELEDLYREALDDDWDDDPVGATDHTVRRNKRATIGSILKFHQYLRKHFGVPALDELASRLKLRGLLPVDANFLTIDEYLCVLDYISGCYGPADPYLRSVLRLIVILAYRCGLRRCEVLYLLIDDLDSADHLHVRNNELRDVKTTNSTRSVPAGILLSSQERAELAAFFQMRKNAPRSRKIGLLFSSKNDASAALDSDSLVRHIHVAMRAALKDESLKVHHLRHSFATLLTAKLLPNMTSFVRGFLKRHPRTLEWLEDRHALREQLFGTSDITSLDLKAVAHILGHGSSATSVEHYIHSLDWFELAAVRP